jgi:hypothetical protein
VKKLKLVVSLTTDDNDYQMQRARKRRPSWASKRKRKGSTSNRYRCCRSRGPALSTSVCGIMGSCVRGPCTPGCRDPSDSFAFAGDKKELRYHYDSYSRYRHTWSVDPLQAEHILTPTRAPVGEYSAKLVEDVHRHSYESIQT